MIRHIPLVEASADALSSRIGLRPVAEEDLPIFFEHQQDASASRMAAFTAKDPADWGAFQSHWARILADETIEKRTVLYEGSVAGHVSKFEAFGEPEVSYWLGREYWGQGIATQALAAFLGVVKTRPLYARAAQDNAGSRRVLEKCGFTVYGSGRGFANARGSEVDEVLLRLDTE